MDPLDPKPDPDRLHRSDVYAWADARMADMMAREFDRSLHVGPLKPMGSMGFETSLRGMWAAWKKIRARRGPGIGFAPFQRGAQVWLYAWHEPTLHGLLARNLLTLEAAGWPHACAAFVARVSSTPVPPLTPLFTLVADAHGDRWSPGRTDVLPGVAREDLFAAFLTMHGVPDPAFVYWRIADLPLPAGYP